MTMRYAIVGTGFVADYYMMTAANHRQLDLAGVFDINPARLAQFCAHFKVSPYPSFDVLLGDATVDLVVVLTNPHSHFAVVRAALEAGKHVYCEKPLALTLGEAQALVALARDRGLVLGGAPANAISPAIDAVRGALEAGRIGRPKLVHAEMEDGPVFRENWRQWRSVSGAPWPGVDEFAVGCTLEHSGYALSWLTALFGTITEICGTSGTFFPHKAAEIDVEAMAPDFSNACLNFRSGVVARLNCGVCGPKDRTLRIFGETGSLTLSDLWDAHAAVHLERDGEQPSASYRAIRQIERWLGRSLPVRVARGHKVTYQRRDGIALPTFPSKIDFMAGVAQVAAVARGDEVGRCAPAAAALHVTEAALALSRISDLGGRYTMKSTMPDGGACFGGA